MFLRTTIEKSTRDFLDKINELKSQIHTTEAIVIGAGAGLSASAGFTYSGERFETYFSDFKEMYHITDMYSGGFYPFSTYEEYWAWWSRQIYYNRYVDAPKPVYSNLYQLVKDKNYFVLTTNVDHQFQKNGFEKERLFYTQGDYGLWQCMEPCHAKTYDNEEIVNRMVAEQKDMMIPTELIPYCPICGKPMTMNLRADRTFVEDEGWHTACKRYEQFINENQSKRVLFLELGVGGNTPVIIKYPFWRFTLNNPKATYVCINLGEATAPREIRKQSVFLNHDIGEILELLLEK